MFSFDTKTLEVYRVVGNDFYVAELCTFMLPQTPEFQRMSFEERFQILIDHEYDRRKSNL